MNECPPGMTPVIRPGGIDLKDGPLFAALNAKIQGKNVGIPVCEGAATTKSPWNAPGKLKKNKKILKKVQVCKTNPRKEKKRIIK